MKKNNIFSALLVLSLSANLAANISEEKKESRFNRLGELLRLDSHLDLETFEMDSNGRVANILRKSKPTHSQPKGPFYPVELPDDTDQDLTITDDGQKANGVAVYLEGHVFDTDGNPIKNARVEIWQACQSGKYNHPRDPNTAKPDPNFQYYADVFTNGKGEYMFKTIVPGPYPANNDWWRPPHIHFMITAKGHKTLITQSYFDGDSFEQIISKVRGVDITGDVINHLNALDYLINQVPKGEEKTLVIKFEDTPFDGKPEKMGVFDVYLEKS